MNTARLDLLDRGCCQHLAIVWDWIYTGQDQITGRSDVFTLLIYRKASCPDWCKLDDRNLYLKI